MDSEKIVDIIHKSVRPMLTGIITLLFNGVCLFAWYKGELNIKEYIMAMAPANSMILGFWFGERAALKTSESQS
jgi:hypothetical protein